VVLSLYGVTLIFLVMGYAVIISRGILIPALLGMAALVLLLCAGQFSFSREWFAVGRVLGNSLEMRREVEYALCLTKWLALEGSRRKSIDGLWADLQTIVQRLGFSGVRLTLEDGTRYWERAQESGEIMTTRHELHGGRNGILELKAMVNPNEDEESDAAEQSFGTIADGKAFEIMSELVAEGWLKATKAWEEGDRGPLRFDSKSNEPGEERKASGLIARLTMRPANPKPQPFQSNGLIQATTQVSPQTPNPRL
jgi:hypothetical protein